MPFFNLLFLSVYLRIYLSLFQPAFFSLLCRWLASAAARPHILCTKRAIFIFSLSFVMFLYTLEYCQHAVLYAFCYDPHPPVSYSVLSIPSDQWSPQYNFIWLLSFPIPLVQLNPDDVGNSIYRRYSLTFVSYRQSICVTNCKPRLTVLFHPNSHPCLVLPDLFTLPLVFCFLSFSSFLLDGILYFLTIFPCTKNILVEIVNVKPIDQESPSFYLHCCLSFIR